MERRECGECDMCCRWLSHNDMVKFFDTEGKDMSKWIETDNVGFKYNRLVMFNPFLWHSNGDWFGNTYDNCRLVQLFFFHGAG